MWALLSELLSYAVYNHRIHYRAILELTFHKVDNLQDDDGDHESKEDDSCRHDVQT